MCPRFGRTGARISLHEVSYQFWETVAFAWISKKLYAASHVLWLDDYFGCLFVPIFMSDAILGRWPILQVHGMSVWRFTRKSSVALLQFEFSRRTRRLQPTIHDTAGTGTCVYITAHSRLVLLLISVHLIGLTGTGSYTLLSAWSSWTISGVPQSIKQSWATSCLLMLVLLLISVHLIGLTGSWIIYPAKCLITLDD